MYPEKPLELTPKSPVVLGSLRTLAAFVVATMLLVALPARAQSSGSSGNQQAQPGQSQQDDQVPAAAGGAVFGNWINGAAEDPEFEYTCRLLVGLPLLLKERGPRFVIV